MSINRSRFVEELVAYFTSQQFTVHGAKGLSGFSPPPPVSNDGFGDLKPRVPDVVGLDEEKLRIVFGLVRETKEELEAEQSLTDYNVFLDHRQGAGGQASLLVVLLPPPLVPDFTNIMTHYIHRDYWHRVIAIASKTE